MTLNRFATVAALALTIAFIATPVPAGAQVKAGDLITSDNASKVETLVSPGNLILVKQGMTMKIVPTGHLDWPPPYKAATEKYSAQVSLTSNGELKNYVAGLPFPMVDANDPQAATKIMWNFAFRPLYTDDIDARKVEIVSHVAGSVDPIEHFSLGHMGFYKYVGRTEVAPLPLDPDVLKTGIAFRAGAYPVLDPPELRGAGIIMQGYAIPGFEDAVWEYSSGSRKLRRLSVAGLSDSFGVSKTLLGEQQMLAPVEAENSPAKPCPNDGNRTICTENWEMRHLYVIEATAKPRSPIGGSVIIPKRILYIDSEAWIITASDQFDGQGHLWKTLANFNAYRDRPVSDAKVAIWPFKRMFETALVDEDVTDGFSTVIYSPGPDSHDDGWYINMGAVDKTFFTPEKMVQAGH